MKINLRKPFTVIIGAILALTAISAASASPSTQVSLNTSYHIVALGDSLTVGYEQGMTAESIPYGYVDRIYDQALFHGRADLANYGIMGLTTPGLINLLQGASEGKTLTSADLQDFSSFQDGVSQQADTVAARAPEVAASLKEADLIVMTIGANDFGDFIKSMIQIKQPTEETTKLINSSFDVTMNKYTEDLDKMLRQLHIMAPNAQIMLADQYLPLWNFHVLYPDLLAQVDKLADRLDVVVEGLAKEGIPAKVVHISPQFKDNERTYTYINTFDYDNHPNQKGYRVIAEAFADVIWKEYREPAPRAEGISISVIINSEELISTPILKNGTTFLAIRDVAQAVQAEKGWIPETKTATFRKDGREVFIPIGSKTIVVNGVEQEIAVPAYLQQGTTYVPLAVISRGLGYNVVYRGELKTAFVNS